MYNIVHVLGNLGTGGAEMGVIRLADALNDGQFSNRILVLGSDLSLQKATGTKVPCDFLGIDGPSYTAFLRLSEALRGFKTDLVHVNNLAPWFDSALGARLAGCHCIQTFHGVEQSRLEFSKIKKITFKAAFAMSQAIAAVSEPAAYLCTTLTGIDQKFIRVIPNGIDTSLFHPPGSSDEKVSLRRKLNLPEDRLLLGCVAALRPVKNHRGLISAFSSTLDTSSCACLVLVGDGVLENELRKQVQELGIVNNVLFMGSRRDVPEILKALDVFFLNSETEGLSYSMLEAMSSGLPVVATDVGGNPQLITQGEEGFLVPYGDDDALACIMRYLYKYQDILESMGKIARKKVLEKYDHDVMVQAYRQLYLETIRQ